MVGHATKGGHMFAIQHIPYATHQDKNPKDNEECQLITHRPSPLVELLWIFPGKACSNVHRNVSNAECAEQHGIHTSLKIERTI